MSSVVSLEMSLRALTPNTFDQAMAITSKYKEFDSITNIYRDLCARLAESFRRARSFTADASHEIKTPLTILRGNAERLIAELPQGVPAQRIARSMADEVERLIKISQQLILLSQADSDALIVDRQSFDLSGFIDALADDAVVFEKNIIITALTLSEDFIKKAIDIDYFELEDVRELNMNTYAGLSSKFTKLYENYINWERMILYLCSSDKIDDISKYEWVIEKFNLWKLISGNQLPIDFIRKNRSKLDWRIVSIINDFSDEEKDEFVENIPNYKEEWDKFKEESNDFKVIFSHQGSKFTPSRFSMPSMLQKEDISIKDIRKMIENTNVEETENKRFEVKHSMDKLSDEDLLQIKKMIRSGNANKF
jgi:hypothetical protein